MKDGSKTEQTRREFLRVATRGGALGALALLAALLGRRGWPGRDDHKCINQGLCRGCQAFDDCILPQAVSAGRAKGGG